MGAAIATIEDVLNRRSDLSTFVVHLTRVGSDGRDVRSNLDAILAGGRLEARSPMGWARDQAQALGEGAAASQRVVCFSEAPLEHIYSLAAPIADRQNAFAPFGLAFTKMVARRRGVNPVWYVDKTPTHDWVIGKALDQLRADAIASGDIGFPSHPAAELFPFCEWMGTWPTTGGQKEFWWEREWRHRGDFTFDTREVALVIAPAADHRRLTKAFARPCVDAGWGLERMIGALAGLGEADMTPFSA